MWSTFRCITLQVGSWPYWAARKLTGDTLNVAWAEFSTLSLAGFVLCVIAQHRQAHPHLELKTQPMSCPVDFTTVLLMTVRKTLNMGDITTNGITSNDITSNEITSNDITSNDITSNDITSNDITSNAIT